MKAVARFLIHGGLNSLMSFFYDRTMAVATSTSRESFNSPWLEVNTNPTSTLRSCSERAHCQRRRSLPISSDRPLFKDVSQGSRTAQEEARHADADGLAP